MTFTSKILFESCSVINSFPLLLFSPLFLLLPRLLLLFLLTLLLLFLLLPLLLSALLLFFFFSFSSSFLHQYPRPRNSHRVTIQATLLACDRLCSYKQIRPPTWVAAWFTHQLLLLHRYLVDVASLHYQTSLQHRDPKRKVLASAHSPTHKFALTNTQVCTNHASLRICTRKITSLNSQTRKCLLASTIALWDLPTRYTHAHTVSPLSPFQWWLLFFSLIYSFFFSFSPCYRI